MTPDISVVQSGELLDSLPVSDNETDTSPVCSTPIDETDDLPF